MQQPPWNRRGPQSCAGSSSFKPDTAQSSCHKSSYRKTPSDRVRYEEPTTSASLRSDHSLLEPSHVENKFQSVGTQTGSRDSDLRSDTELVEYYNDIDKKIRTPIPVQQTLHSVQCQTSNTSLSSNRGTKKIDQGTDVCSLKSSSKAKPMIDQQSKESSCSWERNMRTPVNMHTQTQTFDTTQRIQPHKEFMSHAAQTPSTASFRTVAFPGGKKIEESRMLSRFDDVHNKPRNCPIQNAGPPPQFRNAGPPPQMIFCNVCLLRQQQEGRQDFSAYKDMLYESGVGQAIHGTWNQHQTGPVDTARGRDCGVVTFDIRFCRCRLCGSVFANPRPGPNCD